MNLAPSSPHTEVLGDEMIRKIAGRNPRQTTAEKIKKYCKELYKSGWKSIAMTYSGCGDSCNDVDFSIANEEGSFDFSAVTIIFSDGSSLDSLTNLLWDMLPVGFENNDGGEGTVKITTKTGRIVIEHTTFYTESKTSKTSF